jgi:cystathionine gamma-lyase
MSEKKSGRFATRAVHAGQPPDPVTGSVMPPLYLTSTYVQDGVGRPRSGYEYARVSNPTRSALEANLAAMEDGRFGAAFASGLAAIEALLKATLKAGDHLVCGIHVYGGTERMLRTVWSKYDLRVDFVDTSDQAALRAALRDDTRLVHIETPSNPMMLCTDIAASAEAAHAVGALLSVDNTFATPWLQLPLALGADVVMHSTTKYLNGHSDMVGGALITDEEQLAEAFHYQQKATGGVPGPFDCWLVLRGTKTLHVRMRAHCENAARIAAFLCEHREVESVHFPGLASHPHHELAKRQMRDFGGMLSVDLGAGERARRFAEGTRLFALAESRGGVESLLSVPAAMTHASVPEERRREMGLTDGLVRISVGIEDVDDLLEDLEGALDSL